MRILFLTLYCWVSDRDHSGGSPSFRHRDFRRNLTLNFLRKGISKAPNILSQMKLKDSTKMNLSSILNLGTEASRNAFSIYVANHVWPNLASKYEIQDFPDPSTRYGMSNRYSGLVAPLELWTLFWQLVRVQRKMPWTLCPPSKNLRMPMTTWWCFWRKSWAVRRRDLDVGGERARSGPTSCPSTLRPTGTTAVVSADTASPSSTIPSRDEPHAWKLI